ncbi:MAG: hypothetical protein K6F09_07180 [Clostridiales bacterium]|nr:hypothetical protein [Clostridiales bacterium]
MKDKRVKKSPTGIIIAVVAVIVALGVTLAAFIVNVDITRTLSVSNFTAGGTISFYGADVSQYTNSNGTVSVNYRDSTAPNYITKLRISVKYRGNGVGLLRVKIAEEWSTTTAGVKSVMPYKVMMPYVLASSYDASSTGNQSAWYDNRANDYCYYYATPIIASSEEKTINLLNTNSAFDVSSFDSSAIANDAELNLAVYVDAVQVNRYPQYWHLNRLPWTYGDSSSEVDLP